MSVKTIEFFYSFINSISNIEVYMSFLLNILFPSDALLLVFFILWPLTVIAYIISFILSAVLAGIIIFNIFALFFMPILFTNELPKKNNSSKKFLIPIYNIYLLCQQTETCLFLYFIVITSMLFNKPFSNLWTFFLGKENFIQDKYFIIIVSLIFGIGGLVLIILLFCRTKEYIRLGYMPQKKSTYKNKITKDTEKTKICNTKIATSVNTTDNQTIDQNIITNSITPKKEALQDPLLQIYQKIEKPNITEKPKKKCPNCGTGNGLNAKYCLICNTAFKDNTFKN